MSPGRPEANKQFALRDRLQSFVYALRGLRFFFITQHNAWVHALATICVVALGLLLQIDSTDWRWIVLSIAMVWISEAMNTAIEHLGDGVTTNFDARIGAAKDIAAGAVLISALAAGIIGIVTFAPYILARFPV